jgi:hypothetical protein
MVLDERTERILHSSRMVWRISVLFGKGKYGLKNSFLFLGYFGHDYAPFFIITGEMARMLFMKNERMDLLAKQ